MVLSNRLADLAEHAGEAARRLAFWRTYAEAFKRSQRAARRRWFSAWNGAGWLCTDPVTVAVSVPWEGHQVTVAATCGLRRPEDRDCPIRAVPTPPG